MNEFKQGYLDSLCGIYSIVNADKLINKSSENESQILFNRIVDYLHDIGILRDILIEGVDQKTMKEIIFNVALDRFPLHKTNKRGIISIREWWNYSQSFVDGHDTRAIILSLGGRISHLTTIYRMTNRRIFLFDSGISSILNRADCKMNNYTDSDKYKIYPAQCWYLGKE